MHVLFVHQNFPAQFGLVASMLARRYGWRCTFVTARDDERAMPGVEKVIYRRPPAPQRNAAGLGASFETRSEKGIEAKRG